jgi:hypothetical protein
VTTVTTTTQTTTFPFEAKRLRIVIDTREQAPWSFPVEYAETIRGTLPTGDYALAGDMGFAVERKSLDDFLGTISTGWERFERELDRMDEAKFPAKVIIVEGNFASCCYQTTLEGITSPRHNHPKLTPQFVFMRLAELTFRRVSVLFAGRRDLGAFMAYVLLKERNLQLNG